MTNERNIPTLLPLLATRKSMLALCAAFGVLGFNAPAGAKATYTNFDPPGSTNTQPYCINNAGTIAGNYYDGSGVSHGFLRAVDGTITTFDPPRSTNTQVGDSGCINDSGVIAGSYKYNGRKWRGYLRHPDGHFKTFDVPESTGTYAYPINNKGLAGGAYSDSSGAHGFLRDKKGAFTTFDATKDSIFSVPAGIDKEGNIGGEYSASDKLYHSFVRTVGGTITLFDVKGSIQTLDNDSHLTSTGALTGHYQDNKSDWHGYVRTADGTITTFDAPNDTNGTYAQDVNDTGTITGWYENGNLVWLGFVRTRDGTITTFSDPDAGKGTNQGMQPWGINNKGWIEGNYEDSNSVVHGFLRTP
jgi:hypothetical protein